MSEKVQPVRVYHYTGADGFKGIIEKQEIWATSIYYLNDPSEFWYGRNAFIENARVLLKSKEAEAVREMLLFLERSHPDLFVCSFSGAKTGDDLSLNLWRLYCPNGGCAIGFPIDKLLAHAHSLGLDMYLCNYGSPSSKETVQRFADIVSEVMLLCGGLSMFRFQFQFENPLMNMLLKFITQYKHTAYSAEEEHRLVSLRDYNSKIRYRMSGSLSVPYVAFSLKNEELWEQADIVLGPCSSDSKELTLESVKMFLESELKKNSLPTTCVSNVRRSQIPYRYGLQFR